MSDSAKGRPYSYVRHLREIRDRINDELADMTPAERLEWHQSQEFNDPMLRRLAVTANPPTPSHTKHATARALRLMPYPRYKPSGLQWLGDVPEHWELRRLRHVCRFSYGDSLSSRDRRRGDVPVYGSNGRIGTHAVANTDGPCLIIGRKGSFGKVAYSATPTFAIDTTFFVDQRHTDADMQWLYYVLVAIQLDTESKASAIPGLSRTSAYDRVCLYPPPDEQRAIARYLNRETAKIDALIGKNEMLVERLNEQRTALVSRTVIRGLPPDECRKAGIDPNSKLKPSGVEWLGDVPDHWGVRRGKSIMRPVDVRSVTGQEELLTVSATHGVVPRASPDVSVTMFKAESYVGYKLCWSGDLVINSLWAWAYGLGVARRHGIVSSAYGVYRLLPQYSEYAKYIHYLVRSFAFHWELQTRSKGIWISRLQLTDESFLAASFPVPPSREQAAIAEYLDRATRNIDNAIRLAGREIAFLCEYRTRLVSDAVTGKIDVRGIIDAGAGAEL